MACYKGRQGVEERAEFEEEVERRIEDGFLTEYAARGLLPLMVVVQPMKNKTKPALDYHKLNEYVVER